MAQDDGQFARIKAESFFGLHCDFLKTLDSSRRVQYDDNYPLRKNQESQETQRAIMNGEKDSLGTARLLGWIVPILLSIYASLELISGKIYLPHDNHFPPPEIGIIYYNVFRDFPRVWGFAWFKIGIAIAMHAWFALANDKKKEAYAKPTLLCGIVVTVAGAFLYWAGWFV